MVGDSVDIDIVADEIGDPVNVVVEADGETDVSVDVSVVDSAVHVRNVDHVGSVVDAVE